MQNPIKLLGKPKTPISTAPRKDWKGEATRLLNKVEGFQTMIRDQQQIIGTLTKKNQLIEEYLDVFTRTHLQAHWHKTKCHSANRKVLLGIDELFKGKTGYSWINKHIKNCENPICMEYKEGL